MIGRNLLHYRIEKKLGEGGQGAVYRATDTKLGRTVALGREDRAWFEADPDWASLRDDPRFAELMRQLGGEQVESA